MSDFKFDMAAYVRKHREPNMRHVNHRASDELVSANARIDELLAANTRFEQDARDARAAKLKAENVASALLDALGDKPVLPTPGVVITNRSRADMDFDTERRRQTINFGAAHDDKHVKHELTRAAIVYALATIPPSEVDAFKARDFSDALEPWNIATSGSNRQNLICAAALLLAEVERIDRRDRSAARTEAEDKVKAELAKMDPRCNEKKRIAGLAMPRTCTICGLGPCLERRKVAHG